MLTAIRLREILAYDPDTGEFRWQSGHALKRVRKGSVAGCIAKGRTVYRLIRIDYVLYKAHRLAWLYMTGEWPEDEIDHIDCDGTNNRWKNLRKATPHQNHGNARKRRDNSSGHKGVSWFKRDGRWRVQIAVAGKNTHVGYFDHLDDAIAAYGAAARDQFGDFARTA